jgi:murein DD-endopeptidase MepM/ murein hydrolase activator NlpD
MRVKDYLIKIGTIFSVLAIFSILLSLNFVFASKHYDDIKWSDQSSYNGLDFSDSNYYNIQEFYDNLPANKYSELDHTKVKFEMIKDHNKIDANKFFTDMEKSGSKLDRGGQNIVISSKGLTHPNGHFVSVSGYPPGSQFTATDKRIEVKLPQETKTFEATQGDTVTIDTNGNDVDAKFLDGSQSKINGKVTIENNVAKIKAGDGATAYGYTFSEVKKDVKLLIINSDESKETKAASLQYKINFAKGKELNGLVKQRKNFDGVEDFRLKSLIEKIEGTDENSVIIVQDQNLVFVNGEGFTVEKSGVILTAVGGNKLFSPEVKDSKVIFIKPNNDLFFQDVPITQVGDKIKTSVRGILQAEIKEETLHKVTLKPGESATKAIMRKSGLGPDDAYRIALREDTNYFEGELDKRLIPRDKVDENKLQPGTIIEFGTTEPQTVEIRALRASKAQIVEEPFEKTFASGDRAIPLIEETLTEKGWNQKDARIRANEIYKELTYIKGGKKYKGDQIVFTSLKPGDKVIVPYSIVYPDGLPKATEEIKDEDVIREEFAKVTLKKDKSLLEIMVEKITGFLSGLMGNNEEEPLVLEDDADYEVEGFILREELKYSANIPTNPKNPFGNKGLEVTSNYGPRKNPMTNRGTEFHNGKDFRAARGTPVYAIEKAKVTEVGHDGLNGHFIRYEFMKGDKYEIVYAHLDEIPKRINGEPLKENAKIGGNEQIARVGCSGRCTGPHLHMGCKKNGKFINPDICLNLDSLVVASK